MKKTRRKYRRCVFWGLFLCMAPLCLVVWFSIQQDLVQLLRLFGAVLIVGGVTAYSMVGYEPITPAALAFCLTMAAILSEPYLNHASLYCAAYLFGRLLYFVFVQTALEERQAELRGTKEKHHE